MAYANRLDQAAAARRHYDKNKVKVKATAREWTKAQRIKIAAFIRALKEASPCMDCDEHFPYYVMDFDHVRGEKKFDLARAGAKAISFRMIQEEIDKCDLVCANCHRVRTHERKKERDAA